MLQKVMLHPVGSTNTHVKHTAIIRLFSFWLLRTSHTYHIRCHVLSCPNMQETNLEGSIQYHTTCHAMTCYSKCFNAQVTHLSLKATMPQFPCIFCSLSSLPRFHKSATMLSPVLYILSWTHGNEWLSPLEKDCVTCRQRVWIRDHRWQRKFFAMHEPF